ncbi:MAG: helix-turn-helix domain-containing protein [Candidatus Thorarchaeota archaeon]
MGAVQKKKKKPCLEGIQEYCTEDCPYRRVLSVFGKRYTLGILRVLVRDDVARFNKIVEDVQGSTKTITERLNELVTFGIVKREAFAEIPPRVEYSLTESGLDLKPVLDYIREWGKKWALTNR